MSFDKNDGTPIVNVHKRTTKVNIRMVIMIGAFAGFGVFTFLSL